MTARSDIICRAAEVFEDPDKAQRWLHQPLSILDGRTPLETAETDEGAEIVEQILGKIEWGAPA
jgi:putative toxin-antitoxin system antitoxin component (TIGR02293 family)